MEQKDPPGPFCPDWVEFIKKVFDELAY